MHMHGQSQNFKTCVPNNINNIISHCNLYLINYKPIKKLNIYSFNLKVITCYKSHFIEIISYVA